MGNAVEQAKSFGRIDAESENLLGEFFVATDAFERVERRERIIVIDSACAPSAILCASLATS